MNATEYLDQLDQLHAAGTPGEWDTYWGNHIGSGVIKTSPGGVQVDYDICEMQDEDDRACTDNEANPSTPGADAKLIVAAVNALPQLTAALREVLTEHRPLVNSPYKEPACPHCLGGIHAEDIDAPRSCGCWGLSTPVCSSCADRQGARLHPMQWPCPTVQAITAALGPADPMGSADAMGQP